MSRVCVVGLGHIGLPTAAMLASRGHEVVGCDTSAQVVRSVNAGQAHLREPGLDPLVAETVRAGRLRAQAGPCEAEFFLIAVPTPFAEGHRPDLSHVEAAADAIAPLLRPDDVVILESTSPVGTTERLARRLAAARPELRLPVRGAPAPAGGIRLAHCPERILPGRILHELVGNDRIVGGVGEDCAARAAALYEGWVEGRVVLCDSRTAEFVKLAENAFRDVNIAFANELSLICERLGIDVWRAIALANRHPRVDILRPGPGVGGHCIAVDPWFIVDGAPEEARLIRTAREVNDAKPRQVAAAVRRHAARFRDPVIACYGLTYKADVGDIRESPSLAIVRDLAADGAAEVLVCDPWIASLPAELAGLPHVALADADAARRRADIVVLLVGHRQFRDLDAGLFLDKVVVDAAGLMSRDA